MSDVDGPARSCETGEALCKRCGLYPLNKRKAIRSKGLCCNNCPDHGPWCSQYAEKQCPGHNDVACTPKLIKKACRQPCAESTAGAASASGSAASAAEGPPAGEALASEVPTEGGQLASEEVAGDEAATKAMKPGKRCGPASSSDKPTKLRPVRSPTRKPRAVADDDETPARKAPVEAALRRVEQEFQKKLDLETKRNERRKKEVARELKETRRRLNRRSMLRSSMMKRQREKNAIKETPQTKAKTANPFFAGEDDETAAAAAMSDIDGISVPEVPASASTADYYVASPVSNQVAQNRPSKLRRRSSLPAVLNDMKDVYAIIDDIKLEREDKSQVKQEGDDEECHETPPKSGNSGSEKGVAADKNSHAIEPKLEAAEDDGDSMDTCKSQASGEDMAAAVEEESPAAKRRRGDAALLRAKQVFKEIMCEKMEDQRAKRVVTPNTRYEAFDDDSRFGDDETPRATEKLGSSKASGSSEFLLVPARVRPVSADADSRPSQPRSLLESIAKRATPVPKIMAADKMQLQRARGIQ